MVSVKGITSKLTGGNLPSFTVAQWAMLLGVVLVSVLWLVALWGLFFPSESYQREAYANGKNAKIILVNGLVEGNVAASVEDALRDGKTSLAADEEAHDVTPTHAEDPEHKAVDAHAKKDEHQAENSAEEPAKVKHEADTHPKDTPDESHDTPKSAEEKPEADKKNAASVKAKPVAKKKLKIAPINPNLLENSTEFGALPMIDEHGTAPWIEYARPSPVSSAHSVVSIVVTGLGLSELSSREALSLPAEVSLSFSPYVRGVTNWTEKSREAGHEVWMDLPMEFADYPASDPGPLGLMKGLSSSENAKRLKKFLARTNGYVGVVTPKDEAFSANMMMKNAHQELSRRGVLSLMQSHVFKPAQRSDMVLYTNRYLSRSASPKQWTQTLAELESIAKHYGFAVGVVEAAPGIFSALKQWHKGLNPEQVELVPLTAIVGRKAR